MTLDQVEARIQTVRKMIASYSITLAAMESESRYAKRKIAEYDHELDTLISRKAMLCTTQPN